MACNRVLKGGFPTSPPQRLGEKQALVPTPSITDVLLEAAPRLARAFAAYCTSCFHLQVD